MKLGSFVRFKDGKIARVYSAARAELLDGTLVGFKENDVTPVEYSKDYSQLVDAVFDVASRISSIEDTYPPL